MKRTFLAFLEATGDTKFDKMMGDMKAKATASRDFGERIKGVADSLPGELKRQAELEKWMESELKRVRLIPQRQLKRFEKELAPIADGYREDTSPLEMLYFHASSKDPHKGYHRGPDDEHEENLQDVANAFMHNHLDDVQDACTAWWAAMEQLKKDADSKDWPIKNWQRHSKYDSERSHARSVIEFLQHWWK